MCTRAQAHLSVIDVADGTNVHVGLRALIRGICAVDLGEAGGGPVAQGRLKGAGIAILEAVTRGPQERRNGLESGRHFERRRPQLQRIKRVEEK